MIDYPSPPYSEDTFGLEESLPEDCKESCCSMCENKSADELRSIAHFFDRKASDLTNKINAEITMEDFEKLKKEDNSMEEME